MRRRFPNSRQSGRRCDGFTLIETTVAIGILTLTLAMVLAVVETTRKHRLSIGSEIQAANSLRTSSVLYSSGGTPVMPATGAIEGGPGQWRIEQIDQDVPDLGVNRATFLFLAFDERNIASIQRYQAATRLVPLPEESAAIRAEIPTSGSTIALSVSSSNDLHGQGEGGGEYPVGSWVWIHASPTPNHPFSHWVGDRILDPNAATTQVFVDDEKTVQAVFN